MINHGSFLFQCIGLKRVYLISGSEKSTRRKNEAAGITDCYFRQQTANESQEEFLMKQLVAFPPIIQENCRVLILGSMPGVQSLQAQQYYAHPQNQFWKIMGMLFHHPLPPDYNSRTIFLLEKHIALWDVIHSCYREGSLDSAIRQETAHDFEMFFRAHPGIRFVAFNGTKAQDTFRKQVGFHFPGITFHRLPSTSPAHTMKLAEKLAAWQIIVRMVSEDEGIEWQV